MKKTFESQLLEQQINLFCAPFFIFIMTMPVAKLLGKVYQQ